MAKFIWNKLFLREEELPFSLSIRYDLRGIPNYYFFPNSALANLGYSIEYGWEFDKNELTELPAFGTGNFLVSEVSQETVKILAEGRNKVVTAQRVEPEKIRALTNVSQVKIVGKNSGRSLLYRSSLLGIPREVRGSRHLFKGIVDGIILQEFGTVERINSFSGDFVVSLVGGTARYGTKVLFSIKNVVNYPIRYSIYKRNIQTPTLNWSLAREISIPGGSSYEFLENNSLVKSKEFAIVAEDGRVKTVRCIGGQKYGLDQVRKSSTRRDSKVNPITPFFSVKIVFIIFN